MYIADLHIHSKYSRATSRDCDLPHLDLWARRKGIQLVGTGDFTHPTWRQEMAELLEPAEEGFYTLKQDARLADNTDPDGQLPRFVVTGEISSIYKKNGKTRKVHNLILLPGLEPAEALACKLEAIGNIHSDGRPILGLDSKDLLAITLETCPQAVFIPAHIWTPHFSLFGTFSGFDTIEECFEDLTPYIHGVETGLSSDPPMNWQVSALDGLTLVSNSDAHSPAKLGREANLLDCPLDYPSLALAIQTGEGFRGTLEFFPEEGKYHLDGHRNCNLCLQPGETVELAGKCPICGKKITIGVQHRVEELADRPLGFQPPQHKPFESIVPLPEVVAASIGASAISKKTAQAYEGLLAALGPEFYILRQAPLEEIRRQAGPCVMEGIRRLRTGQVRRIPGYDGEYGKIELLEPGEIEALQGQMAFFDLACGKQAVAKPKRKASVKAAPAVEPVSQPPTTGGEQLNPQQQQAVTTSQPVVAVVAGPGTGKTKTLVARIAYLVETLGVKPKDITAVTFTNQAAGEMRQRLEQRLGGKRAVAAMTIGTFHAICLQLLGDVTLLSQEEALEAAAQVLQAAGAKGTPRSLLQAVSKVKNGETCQKTELAEPLYLAYCQQLEQMGVLDFDDLLLQGLALSQAGAGQTKHLLVDEFQDINDLQYQLVRQWSQGGQSLFVIGDPDQAIYGFRGASSRCFAKLAQDEPDLQEIRLVENYRSTPEVLACALPAINCNPGQPRQLEAFQPSGQPVRLVEAASDFAEAIFIAKEISRLTGGIGMLEAQEQARERQVMHAFDDIAVLYRTHRQGELIEKCLRHDSIPCIVSGREDFLTAPEVRGAIGFFRSLLRVGDAPSLIACLRDLWACPLDLAKRVATVCGQAKGYEVAALRQEFCGLERLTPWLDAVEAYLPLVTKEKPHKLLGRWLQQQGETPALRRLRNMAVFHRDLPAFLQNLVLGQEGDLRRSEQKDYASGAVRLMTLHGAKGLEFPVVFLAGVKQDVLPLESPKHPADLAEERRLFYVGITRARQELVLTTMPEPSVFLKDIPPAILQREQANPVRPQGAVEQLSFF